MMPEELLPCPFCGGKAEFAGADFKAANVQILSLIIECTGCGVRTRLDRSNRSTEEKKSVARECWNRRVDREAKTSGALGRGEVEAIRSGLKELRELMTSRSD